MKKIQLPLQQSLLFQIPIHEIYSICKQNNNLTLHQMEPSSHIDKICSTKLMFTSWIAIRTQNKMIINRINYIDPLPLIPNCYKKKVKPLILLKFLLNTQPQKIRTPNKIWIAKLHKNPQEKRKKYKAWIFSHKETENKKEFTNSASHKKINNRSYIQGKVTFFEHQRPKP